MKIRRGDGGASQTRGPDVRLSCVFEDDGRTGYLYALIYDGSAQPIKDAVQIYDAEAAANDHEHELTFVWSASGDQCGLFLDGVLEGFVDFDRKLVSARSNFPAISPWSKEPRAAWRDDFVEYFGA